MFGRVLNVAVDAGNDVGRKAPVGAEQDRTPIADSTRALLPLLTLIVAAWNYWSIDY